MTIIILFAGIVIGGAISWIVAHQYYQKSTEDQRKIYSKLSNEIRNAILNSTTKKLTVKDLNKLLDQKTIDEEAGYAGDPLPFKTCPKCGSLDLSRSSVQEQDDDYFVIECKKCGWVEWSQ